ncbi:YdcF family protein [Candidatus Uhrbacteria bacterium]|nr:YdcF family protein [Candidatus Uhrbacteria bacterium]
MAIRHKKIYQHILFFMIGIVGIFFCVIVFRVQTAYQDRIQTIDSVSSQKAALVLGASLLHRQPGTALEDRLETALELYNKKKVSKLLLSGDNRSVDYNEPMAMKRYLFDKGVPEEDLVLDFAGRRTYDSCYRAKEIFGLSSVIVVTQKYHLSRALYLCNRIGLDTYGVSADRHAYGAFLKWETRELIASFLAWIDTHSASAQPLLGEKEFISFE